MAQINIIAKNISGKTPFISIDLTGNGQETISGVGRFSYKKQTNSGVVTFYGVSDSNVEILQMQYPVEVNGISCAGADDLVLELDNVFSV